MKVRKLQFLLGLSALVVLLLFTIGCKLDEENDSLSSDKGVELENRGVDSRGDSYKKDKYEGDSARSRAKWISPRNQQQVHNFYDDSHDFVKFNAEAYTTYFIETECRGDADTILSVYDHPTADKILRNNNTDKKVDLSSRIIFTNQEAKTIWVEIESNNGKGPNKEYTVRVSRVNVLQSDKLKIGRQWRMTYLPGHGSGRLDNRRYHHAKIFDGGTDFDIALHNGNYRIREGYFEFICDIKKNRKDQPLKSWLCISENKKPSNTYGFKRIDVPNNYKRFKVTGRVPSLSYYGETYISLGGYGSNSVTVGNTLLIRHY